MQNSIDLSKKAKATKAKREKARRNFKNYPELVYDGYKTNWHTDVLCEALQAVYEGRIRFLLVEEPPRHSKSLHVSQLFPSWLFGKNEDETIIVSSYSGDLATDHGRETREMMDSERYQNIFKTKLASDSKAKSKFNTTGKGAYNAAGVGGSITGKGARFFVVDDPYKDRKEADSEVIREARWKWLKSVARTRLTPDGRMIIMHTRWHDDDIVGRTLNEKDWVSYWDWLDGKRAKWVRLKLPAIAEEDEPYRKRGEALWAGHYPLEELEDIKKDIGSYEWSAMYQQNPVDEENQDFKKKWFQYRDMTEVKKLQTRRFLTLDTRGKDDVMKGKDFHGLTTNYVDSEGKWNLMSERRKMNGTDLIDYLFTQHEDHRFEKIGIEDTQYWQGLKPLLALEQKKRGVYLPLKELPHFTNKELRILGLVPRYEYENIFHITIEGSNTCVDLEEELLRFPKAVNDDASDSAATQLEIAQQPSSDHADYYKRLSRSSNGTGVRR